MTIGQKLIESEDKEESEAKSERFEIITKMHFRALLLLS